MAHPHTSLVQQAMVVDEVVISTLAAKTALILNSEFTAITATFLMKRVRYLLQIKGLTSADNGPLVVGVANGNASVAEIGTAMIEKNTAGPADLTQSLTQDSAFGAVYQNSIVAFSSEPVVAATNYQSNPETMNWIQVGGKNGIPAPEGAGFQLFIYNTGNGPMATGATVEGIAHLQGVWLRD